MRLRSLHHPLLGTVSWVALFLLLALLSACGAKQQRSELGYQLPEIEEDGLEFPHLRYTEDGRVIVDQPDAALQKAAFYTLHPLHWDDSLGPEPTIGTGYLHHAAKQTFAIMVASVPNLDFESTRVRAASGLQALTEHKALARVTGLTYEADAPETPIQVRIDLGSATGVTNGDWFYILTGDKLDLRRPRLGDLIGALVRVETVSATHASAEVVHANATIQEGQHAIFAQKTARMSPSPITIAVAPIERDADGQSGDLPSMMTGLPEIAAEYQISHTGIFRLAEFIDPRPWDASYTAEDAAPEKTWGIVVFGEEEDGMLIYNSVGYGNVPSPSGWVGILPGGLPLPFDHDLEELGPQLAVSYLSNGLGMRGDHAHAVYLLESELRTKTLHPRMRYHLREHLALRYAALGRVDEALRIMHYDLLHAGQENDAYSQLNALSIRVYLDREAALLPQAIRDSRAFLSLADGLLPDYALDGERLNLARGLLNSEELDEAEALIMRVVSAAEARGDHRIHLYAITLLTHVQIARDQIETAVLVLDALRANMGAYPKETQVSIRLSAAELLIQIESYSDALELLFESFEDFEHISPASRASMLQRAANIMMSVEQPIQAARAILDAASIYEELGLEPDAAYMWSVAAHLRLFIAQQVPGENQINMLVDAMNEFQRAYQLYLGLGDNRKAAEALVYVAMLQSRFQQTGAKDPLFDQAESMYLALGDFVALAQVAMIRQQMATAFNDPEAADAYEAQARRWLEIGQIDIKEELEDEDIPLTTP